jgi:hypothetical protein
MLAAAVKGDKNVRVATTEAAETCMFLGRLYGANQQFERRRIRLALCHSNQPAGLGCSTRAGGPDIVAHFEAAWSMHVSRYKCTVC